MTFIKHLTLPVMVYLIIHVGASSLFTDPAKVEAKYEELISQSKKSSVLLDEFFKTQSVQVARLTTSLLEMKADMKKIGEQNVELSTALVRLDERITKEIDTAAKAVHNTQSELKRTNAVIAKDVENINKKIAETQDGLGNMKTAINNLKISNVQMSGKVDRVSKRVSNQVSVVSVEQSGGIGRCARVCAGTTGRNKSKWQYYSSSGIYINVSIGHCGFVTVPTVTTSIEGKSWHWRAIGTSSVYSVTTAGFRVYLHTGVRTDKAKRGMWNVEWIAVGYTRC